MGFVSDIIDFWRGLSQQIAMQKQQAAYAEWLEWRAQMFADGWLPYDLQPPPKGAELILMRQEWADPLFRKREDLLPEMNVNGLFWKEWTGKTIDGYAASRPVAIHSSPVISDGGALGRQSGA